MKLKGWGEAKRVAREERKKLSPAELRLWLELKKEPGGHYFRRQHAAGPYRLDFYCAKSRLCIEVDSEAHGFGDRPGRDAVRDAWLEAHGVATLRVPAVEVLGNLEGVIAHILDVIGRRQANLNVPPPLREGGQSQGAGTSSTTSSSDSKRGLGNTTRQRFAPMRST